MTMQEHADDAPRAPADEFVAIAQVLKPRGLRGELKVRLLCSDYPHFLQCLGAGQAILCRPAVDAAPSRSSSSAGRTPRPPPSAPSSASSVLGRFEVESVRSHHGFALLKLKGIDCLDSAENLRSCTIGLALGQLPPLGQDDFYHFQLEGLKVVTAGGEPLGCVERVKENPAHDLLVVRPDASEAKRFLLPLVRAFVQRVDLDAGCVVVDHLPRGLIESQQ